MNLYEINEEIIMAFESAVDTETGEIVDEEAFDNLNRLQMEFENKAENILLWIKNLRADYEALKAEKANFDERMKRAARTEERLTRYISSVLNGNRFSTPKVSATFRKSESVEFLGNISDLPKECIRVKDPEVDKNALKKMVKSGVEIKGAQLVTKNNIQIR